MLGNLIETLDYLRSLSLFACLFHIFAKKGVPRLTVQAMGNRI